MHNILHDEIQWLLSVKLLLYIDAVCWFILYLTSLKKKAFQKLTQQRFLKSTKKIAAVYQISHFHNFT